MSRQPDKPINSPCPSKHPRRRLRGLNGDRRPGSLDEARQMVAYNERILATSQSPQRLAAAERMIANLQPELRRLEREEAERLARIAAAAPPASSFEGQLQRLRDRREEDRAAGASGFSTSNETEKPEALDDEPDPDEDDDVIEADDAPEDEETDAAIAELEAAPAPVVTTRRGRPSKDPAARLTDRRFRHVDEHKGKNEVKPAWWVSAGTSRSTFADAAARRAEELRHSPEADKVKTKLNFVD